MSAIINFILDQQDMRKIEINFRLEGGIEYLTETIDVSCDLLKDKDSLLCFCLETIEQTYGEVKWLRVDRITNN